jgi:hypothetical protein
VPFTRESSRIDPSIAGERNLDEREAGAALEGVESFLEVALAPHGYKERLSA